MAGRRTRMGQRGMTLVELLIAMAVTTIVLTGLAGVLYDVTGRYQGWADQVSGASTGMAIAAALQADSHRYVACHSSPLHLPELDFCLPDTGAQVVTYVASGSGPPWSIVRTQLPGGPGVLMASQLSQQPLFWSQCIIGPGTVSGHIHIYDFRTDDRNTPNTFSVYYRAPLPPSAALLSQFGCSSS